MKSRIASPVRFIEPESRTDADRAIAFGNVEQIIADFHHDLFDKVRVQRRHGFWRRRDGDVACARARCGPRT